jgi:hypothetical protein
MMAALKNAGTPVELKGGGPNPLLVRDATSPIPISFDAPGRQHVSASLGAFVDTLWIQVLDSTDRR